MVRTQGRHSSRANAGVLLSQSGRDSSRDIAKIRQPIGRCKGAGGSEDLASLPPGEGPTRCSPALMITAGQGLAKLLTPDPATTMMPTPLPTATSGQTLSCNGRLKIGSTSGMKHHWLKRLRGRQPRRSLKRRPTGRRPGYRGRSQDSDNKGSRPGTHGVLSWSPLSGCLSPSTVTGFCCLHWSDRQWICDLPAA